MINRITLLLFIGLVFWDGASHGTKYTIEKSKKDNVITQVFNVVN
jgi:hypothetical protein